MKYIQKTFDGRHVVKINGTNIVLSEEDFEPLINLLDRMKQNIEKPMFPPHRSDETST